MGLVDCNSSKLTDLRALLLQQAGTPRGEISTRSVGKWLMASHGRVHNGLRIARVKENSTHEHKYALREN